MTKRLLLLFMIIASLCSAMCVTASANNTKLIALSFEDGPNEDFTPKLLDALAKKNVKVSFFVTGENLEKCPEIARRAFEEGHQLCNHAYSSRWSATISQDSMASEISVTSELISKITGEAPSFFRVPNGGITSLLREVCPLPIAQSSVDPSNGSATISEYYMGQNLLGNVRDGSIVLMRDSAMKDINVALSAIDTLQEQGYEFVTLNELFRLRGISPESGEIYYCLPCDEETAFDESKLKEHWAYKDICYVEENGIMLGGDEGFAPNAYIDRAMAATILWRMANCPEVPKKDLDPAVNDSDAPQNSSGFSDVPDGMWYTTAISWAHANNYISGISEERFAPGESVTKEQFYAMATRFFKSRLSPSSELPVMLGDDGRISSWAKSDLLTLRAAGFVSKNDHELLRPNDFITRAETAELCAWLMQYGSVSASARGAAILK